MIKKETVNKLYNKGYFGKVGLCLLLWANDALWSVRPILGFILMQMVDVLWWFVKWGKYIAFVLVMALALTLQLFYALCGRYFPPMETAKKTAAQMMKTDTPH